MTTRIYRSSDASAPGMPYTAGSAIAVLKACLVDGYGAMAPAGWTHTTVDVATNKAAFTQGGDSPATPSRHIYIDDSESYVGSADVYACSAFTIAASPVLTNRMGSYSINNPSTLLKAGQSAGASKAWIVVANERTFTLLTRRVEWGTSEWTPLTCGDFPSMFSSDLGNFCICGYASQAWGQIPVGNASPGAYLSSCLIYGDTAGVPALVTMASTYEFGGGSGTPGSLNTGASYGSTDKFITQRLFSPSIAEPRVRLPFFWFIRTGPEFFPNNTLPVGYQLDAGDGLVLEYFPFANTDGNRVFLEVAGFTT